MALSLNTFVSLIQIPPLVPIRSIDINEFVREVVADSGTNGSAITTLQSQMTTAQSNITTLQGQMTTANSNITTNTNAIAALNAKVPPTVETVLLDEADITGMFGAAVDLIIPANASTFIWLDSAMLVSNFDTAAYTGGGNVGLYINGVLVSSEVAAADCFGGATDLVASIVPLGGVLVAPGSNLQIKNITAAFTDPGTAQGTGAVIISYRAIDLT